MKYLTSQRKQYLKHAWRLVTRYKWLTVAVVLLSILASIFEGFSLSAIIPFLQNLIEPLSEASAFPMPEFVKAYLLGGDRQQVAGNILVFAAAMIILRSAFDYFRIIAISRTNSLIRRDLQNELFGAVVDSSYKFFSSMKSGDVAGGIVVYADAIVKSLFVFLGLVSNFSRLLIYGGLLIFISWKVTLATVIFVSLFFPLLKWLLTSIKKISQRTVEEIRDLHSGIVEFFSSINLIKISSTEDHEKNRFNKSTTNIADLTYLNSKFRSAVQPVTEIAIMVALITLFLLAVKYLELDVISTLPLIIAYLYIFLKAYTESNRILDGFSSLFQYVEPFRAYVNVVKQARRQTLPVGRQVIKRLQNNIEFKAVQFGYEAQQVLDQVDLAIPKGSFTAFVGPTGGGKTTAANLVAGLMYPDRGYILIDGVDTKDLNVKKWRERIGYIAQDIVVFNDTIKANISYGHARATMAEIIKAAKIANIHEYVNSLPAQYETVVGERGAMLSGGQKQRIAIARAVIRDPELLILDEATSSLDVETERDIQDALERAMRGRTVIAIAHRLSTIMQADNIIVLEDGQVVEQGTHQALIKKRGPYKRYYEMQFGDS